MTRLDRWVADIEGAVTELGNEPGLGIRGAADETLARSIAADGFTSVLPLWTGRRYLVGLLARPGLDARQWAGVLVADGEAVTLSSDASTLLPQLVVARVLSRFPDRAIALAERWEEIGSRALALHALLGGSEASLLAIVAVAGESEAREIFRPKGGHETEFEAAHSRLCRKIDRSKPFERYADWLDSSLAGRSKPPEEPEVYGAWGRRVLCWTTRRAFADQTAPQPSAASLHCVIEAMAGIDSGVSDEPTWAVEAGGASGETMLSEAAMLAAGRQPVDDPIAAALVEAMEEEGASYRGAAHAEAVVALDEGGQPERAWGALQSAAWWAARNTGEAPPAMLDGARLLAKRHSWDDIAWMVDRAKGRP